MYSRSVDPAANGRAACGRGSSRCTASGTEWPSVNSSGARRTGGEHGRHMPCAAVVQGLGVHVGDRDEYRGAERIWNELGHRVELFEKLGRFGAGKQ